MPWEDGVFILRDAVVETEAEAKDLLAAAKPIVWLESSHELDFRDGHLFIFDSAWEGAPTSDQIGAEGGVLDIALKPARYRVDYAAPEHPSGGTYTLIRLKPVHRS